MASIVEKEGVITKNMGPVARVILNRLADDMPLQMDSTVLYAENRDGGPVTSKDLALKTPVQHLSQRGAHPDTDLLPVARRARRPPWTRPRARGSISSWSDGRHRGVRRHLYPAAGQRGAGQRRGLP